MKTACLPSSDVRDYSLEWANISDRQIFTELNGSLANSTDNNWETVGVSVPEPSGWGIMLFSCAVLGLCVWWRNSRGALHGQQPARPSVSTYTITLERGPEQLRYGYIFREIRRS